MYPSAGRKKNCTPRLAWSSLSTVGSDGSAAATPSAGELNTVPVSSCCTLEPIALSVVGRSGVFLYRYPDCIVSSSRQPPPGPPSKSYTVKLIEPCDGSTSGWLASAHPYRPRLSSYAAPVQFHRAVTVSPKHAHPAP